MAEAFAVPRRLEGQLAAYRLLEGVHADLDRAQAEIEGLIGVPLCVEKCGACCSVGTPVARRIEVGLAVSWLAGEPHALRRVARYVKGWLERRGLTVSPRLPMASIMKPQQGEQRLTALRNGLVVQTQAELQACLSGACPLLDEHMRCLVHPFRPLACRVYGLFGPPGPECRRPLGRGEGLRHRAVYAGPGKAAIDKKIAALATMLGEYPGLAGYELFPTGLYRKLRHRALGRLAPKVATVKLLQRTVQGAVTFAAHWPGEGGELEAVLATKD